MHNQLITFYAFVIAFGTAFIEHEHVNMCRADDMEVFVSSDEYRLKFFFLIHFIQKNVQKS